MLAEILWNKDANTETARFKKLNDTPFKGRSSKDQPSFATETSSTPTPNRIQHHDRPCPDQFWQAMWLLHKLYGIR